MTPTTHDRLPYTTADLEWAARTLNTAAADFTVLEDLDELAALEAAAVEAIETGLIPGDLADFIAQRSLVGHDDL